MNFIKNFINRYRPNIIIPLTVLLSFLCVINFYFIFEITPKPNDECIWRNGMVAKDSVAIFFDEVKFEGVTWEAGIRDGDLLHEINGISVHYDYEAADILKKVEGGDSAVYKVSRDGNVFETKVEIKSLIEFGGLGINLLASIWLLVGFVVLLAKPDGYIQLVFYRIGTVFVMYSTFNLLLTFNIENPLYEYPIIILIGDLIWSFGGSFLPFILIHFFWIFPRRFNFINKKWAVRTLYILPTLFFIFLVFIKFFFVYPGHWGAMKFVVAEISILNFLFVISSIIGLVSLFINYLKLDKKNERDAIFLILISFAIGVASIIYTIVIATASNLIIYNSPELFMPIILIALLPIAFAFSIFRYSLLDVSDVIKNTILYGTAMITVAAIYFLVIYLLGQGVSSIIGTKYEGVVAGFVFIVFALIFQSTKDKFQRVITEKFYPEQFAFQKVIMSFSNDISNIVGLDNILDYTNNIMVDSLKVQKFGIMLYDKSNRMFELKRQNGLSSVYFYFENFDSIKNSVDKKVKFKQLPSIDRDEFVSVFGNDQDLLLEEDIYTVIPLRIKNQITGLLLFGLKYSGSQFAGKDLELLVSASNQVAISIENARLYLSESEKLKLDRDLENARRIQESLLPQVIPTVNGLQLSGKMIPAMQVGGDYYDMIKTSDNNINIVVGDVSGKGLPASFYMMKLQTMIQLYAKETSSPKEILSEVNEKISEILEKHWFVTVNLLQIDMAKKIIKFCRAGHAPLIIVKRDKTVKELQPKGIGLGMEKKEVFDKLLEEVEFEFETGDTLLVYSDGVSEAMDRNKQLYSEKRIHDILKNNCHKSTDEILHELLNDINEFKAFESHNDDITIVLAKSL